jgi:HEAT repeat protein
MREIRALRDLLDSGQPEGSIELVRCLQSRSRHVRRAAGRALRASCATTVLEAGARVLAARNRTVVDGVARALGRAGPAAFPILVDALTSDPSRRAGAARALFLAARSADWRRLEGLLTGEDGHLVWWAARLLERSAPSAAGRQHAAQTRRDCEAAAARAYRAIVATGRPDAVEVLSAALHSHGSLAMAEDLLNCGQSDLAEAATRWAGARGYLIRRRPGVPLVRWGRNR